MHRHNLLFLALIIGVTTLHTNAQAAFRRLPAAVPSMRHAMRYRATFTRPFSSHTPWPRVSTMHTGSEKASAGSSMRSALFLAAGLALAGGCGNVAHAEEGTLTKERKACSEFIEAVKNNEQQKIARMLEADTSPTLPYNIAEAMSYASTADTFVLLYKHRDQEDIVEPYWLNSWHFFELTEFFKRASNDEIRILWDSHRTTFDQSLLPLFWLAAATNKGITAETLQNAHVPIDKPCGHLKTTPLCRATIFGDIPTVQGLLKAGADVNAYSDDNKQAPLFCAASCGPGLRQTDSDANHMLQTLLEAGANVNAKDYKNVTALHKAARQGKSRKTCVNTLLKAGAEVNAIDTDLSTPLHQACMSENPSVTTVWLLLQHGARPDAKNVNGRLPADFCHGKSNAYAIRSLLTGYALLQWFQEA